MPEIYVIGGCNGSGKTTFALNIFPQTGNIEFVNADIIAAQLNPDEPDAVAISASRIMLERLKTLARQQADFAFETTLAARSSLGARSLAPNGGAGSHRFAHFLKQCKAQGYLVNLI
nr:AAA family ATPase [Myxosarcina sp. GI1]